MGAERKSWLRRLITKLFGTTTEPRPWLCLEAEGFSVAKPPFNRCLTLLWGEPRIADLGGTGGFRPVDC